jgi:hypothetical protein
MSGDRPELSPEAAQAGRYSSTSRPPSSSSKSRCSNPREVSPATTMRQHQQTRCSHPRTPSRTAQNLPPGGHRTGPQSLLSLGLHDRWQQLRTSRRSHDLGVNYDHQAQGRYERQVRCAIPFKSEAQRGYMWLKHPSIARRWAHEYPGQHDLPEHVDDKKKKHKKAAFFSSFLTLCKGAAYNVQTGLGAPMPAMPALRPAAPPPAGPPQGSGMALPKANPLTMVGTHQNAHQQPGAPVAPGQLQNRPQNPSLQPTNTPAGSMDIQSMLAAHARQLLNTPANKGQAMPKIAVALPQVLYRLTSANRADRATNSAGTLLAKAASAAREVLEKCAQLKKVAYPRQPYQSQRYGFRV